MSAKGLRNAAVVGTAIAIVGAGAALATAPLPQRGKVYDNGVTVGKDKVTMAFVIAMTNAKVIASGVPAFTKIAHSGGYLACPRAKSTGTLPFVVIDFPRTTLKLSGGKYRFSVSETRTNPPFLGSLQKGTIRLRITGTVTSPTRITGTVSASGDACTTSAPLPYRASLDRKARG